MPYKINGEIKDKVLLQYVPHGINEEQFKPLPDNDKQLQEFKGKIFGNKKYNYVILYNSRNVHRKRTSNIILAYRQFCDNLSKEDAKKCCLILHSEIISDAGTNLIAVKEALCPSYDIIFSPGKIEPDNMKLLYNSVDVTVNASSNEGFGLSIAESLMCGVPVIATVTGGLQDQIGQTDENGNPIEFTLDFGSNTDGKYKNHGPWAYPLHPVTRLVQGSPMTPFILDDICTWESIAEGMMYWWMVDDKTRKQCGMAGRTWSLNDGGFNAKNMCNQFINGMDFVFNNWVKPKKFGIYTEKDYVGNTMYDGHMGFEIPKIDTHKLNEKIKFQTDKLLVKEKTITNKDELDNYISMIPQSV